MEEIDWSAPVTKLQDDELKLDWDTDHESEAESVEENKISQPKTMKDKLKSVSKDESARGEGEAAVTAEDENINNPHTMISIELKLACCLKLMCEELVSMVGQIEGTELRLHLYSWLEKQVIVFSVRQFAKNLNSVNNVG